MIKRFINWIFGAIRDPERDISERLFLILTLVSELAVFVAFIGDLVTGESTAEILILIATLTSVPLISFIGLKKERLDIAMKIVVIGLVIIILPSLFLNGGGIEGGGILWVIFAYLYGGLLLTGALRVITLTVLTLLTIACYTAEYYYPHMVHRHARKMFYIDSLISLLLVGIVCYVICMIQKRMFTEENERARKEAERAEELTRSQNRFFSSMSHEIRTPINSILGLNELILRDTEASEEIVKDASGIQGAGKMLLALINDILDFSKMEAGSMDIVPVDYRVGDMLSEIVNMIWLRAEEKGLRLEVSVDPRVPSVLYGDEVRIKQIIINLLNNAVKYTSEGEVGLRIECEDYEDRSKTTLLIAVSDTGMGIRKEAIPYLFDAFKRVDQEKNRMIEGTGLGLSIVKQITELMDGTVTMNSVYGEGSTFTVSIPQRVSDPSEIGELNIQSQQTVRVNAYESSFKAPGVSVLIVDDNEMNLEVECRLLADTEMTIDKALSGRAALELSLSRHYDVILMDHLMPEMDGIECFANIRKQSGGLNRSTPVIVLTANAGSDNMQLYHRTGFDGYLVKPVSGEALEEMLMKYISADKMMISSKMMSMHRDIDAASTAGKLPVVITSTSMSDIPDNLLKKLDIDIVPYLISTDHGVFKDGVQMDAGELIRYTNAGGKTLSSPADEATYTTFFAENLKKAHHVIHITITSSMSKDYRNACEAARSFDNVTVINSEVLSSATGLLVLIGYKLARQGLTPEEIVSELESVKKRLKCSFILDRTDYMMKRRLVSPTVHKIASLLNLHPCLKFHEDRSYVGGIWAGSSRRAYRRYIRNAIPVDVIPDEEVVFITYVDIPQETLDWIKEQIKRTAYFEKVIFKQASASISSNCGPGTFGVLYFVKGNKSYGLGTLFENEELYYDTVYTEEDTGSSSADEEKQLSGDASSFADAGDMMTEGESQDQGKDGGETASDKGDGLQKLGDVIDLDLAIKNSGSKDAFKAVLDIFLESAASKEEEIERYHDEKDWKNYAIKVHALKSSAKIIGAMKLAEAAQALEDAGKASDTEFIGREHSAFIEDFRKLVGQLAGASGSGDSAEPEKPMADSYLIESIFEGLQDAAERMDCDALEEIAGEMGGYSYPEDVRGKMKVLLESAEKFDYDAILRTLGQ